MRRNISSGGPYEKIYGYSRAVRVGNTVHVAGTCAQPPHITGCDAYQQALSALSIVTDSLDAAGAELASVVRTVTYVTDIQDAGLVGRAHLEVFGDIQPAATLVAVSALLEPEMLVEIEAYAIIEGKSQSQNK